MSPSPLAPFSKRLEFVTRRWPVVLIGCVILLFLIGTATIRESYRGWQVDREILALQSQADELEGRNATLRDLAKTLQSPERVEVEAHTRLGMREPGEHVVVLSDVAATGGWLGAVPLDVVAEKPHVDKSNPQLWFDYFFRPNELN